MNSDHKLLVARLKLPSFFGLIGHKRRKNKGEITTKYNVDRLDNPEIQKAYKSMLKSKLDGKPNTESGKQLWNYVADAIKETAESTLGKKNSKRETITAYDGVDLAKWSSEQMKLRNQDKRKQMKSQRNHILR